MPEQMPVPPFRYRLPADVAVRIRATARPADPSRRVATGRLVRVEDRYRG